MRLTSLRFRGGAVADPIDGKLHEALRVLERSPLAKLQDPSFIADTIRIAGLVFDARRPYGTDNAWMNRDHRGLWQIPLQLGRCLAEISRYNVRSAIEIGTWSGWTTAFLATFLACVNGRVSVTSVDRAFSHATRMPRVVRLYTGTSADFADNSYDLAVIDGNHSYDWCCADYDAVGRRAAICMFHDINDKFVRRVHSLDGGAPRFWREMKLNAEPGDQLLEFLDHSERDQIMGIGLRVRPSARQRT